MLTLLAGSFLGGSLGANDAANCFGTAVSARMVAWRQAAMLAAVFVVLGAVSQGEAGLETLRGLTLHGNHTAGLTALAAGLTVATMTVFALPVSTSQAVVGALLGVSLTAGERPDLGTLGKIVLCWVGTPVGAMLMSWVVYHALRWLLRRLHLSLFSRDAVLRFGLLVCGCYAAHALGANNVANVATFLIADPRLAPREAILIGGLTIAAGALAFSRRVMLTVGRGITQLDGFSALVVVLAQAVTVHFYAWLGVPVSTSQAIVGAVLGLGLVRGVQILDLRVLGHVLLGWVLTPTVAAIASATLAALASPWLGMG
jgi:PiT family inorganic phosphate transporter